jgi:hypothetical protein
MLYHLHLSSDFTKTLVKLLNHCHDTLSAVCLACHCFLSFGVGSRYVMYFTFSSFFSYSWLWLMLFLSSLLGGRQLAMAGIYLI